MIKAIISTDIVARHRDGNNHQHDQRRDRAQDIDGRADNGVEDAAIVAAEKGQNGTDGDADSAGDQTDADRLWASPPPSRPEYLCPAGRFPANARRKAAGWV